MGSELMRIAEGFSIVAEGLRGLAKAEGGTKEKAVKAQKVEKSETVAEVQQESPATLEGIRALMAQKTQEGKSKEIKELLQKYGAAKLSAVKAEDYPVLMQEAQVLCWGNTHCFPHLRQSGGSPARLPHDWRSSSGMNRAAASMPRKAPPPTPLRSISFQSD